MTFSEYLKICHTFFGEGENITEFMRRFFSEITIDDGGKTNLSCPFTLRKDDSKSRKAYSGDRNLSGNDAKFLKGHFREDVLIEKVEELPESVQQSLIDELKKFDIESDYGSLSNDMSRLFREILEEVICDKNAKTRKKESDNKSIKELSNDNNKESIGLFDFKRKLESISKENIDIAKNFCIDYEDKKSLFPLCQVALNLNPCHNHVREMFTEFLRLNEETQKAIMYLNEIPLYNFEEDWQYYLLAKFRDDVLKYKLSERDMFYDGGKYFHNARKYPDFIIENADPCIFPATPAFRPNGPIGDMRNYIDEYLFYSEKDNEDALQYIGEPPLKWMINNLDLLTCEEDIMVCWMNLFVYNACHVLSGYVESEHLYNVFFTPPLEDLDTMEDLYYASLLSLFELYCC